MARVGRGGVVTMEESRTAEVRFPHSRGGLLVIPAGLGVMWVPAVELVC